MGQTLSRSHRNAKHHFEKRATTVFWKPDKSLGYNPELPGCVADRNRQLSIHTILQTPSFEDWKHVFVIHDSQQFVSRFEMTFCILSLKALCCHWAFIPICYAHYGWMAPSMSIQGSFKGFMFSVGSSYNTRYYQLPCLFNYTIRSFWGSLGKTLKTNKDGKLFYKACQPKTFSKGEKQWQPNPKVCLACTAWQLEVSSS